jgi:hypothetical protein
MKKGGQITKVALLSLSILVLAMFLAGMVIPNLVEESHKTNTARPAVPTSPHLVD